MTNPKLKWKRQDNLTKLLSLLQKHGEVTFKKLKEMMDVSEPTLNNYIKVLLNAKKIEANKKREDRRNTWYRIPKKSRQTVETQIVKFEVKERLGSVENLTILNFLDVFLLEYNLLVAEKQAKGQPIDLREIKGIIKQAMKKMLEAHEAHKLIADVAKEIEKKKA